MLKWKKYLLNKCLILGFFITLAGVKLYGLDTAMVIRVIDGDTLKVECKGEKVSLRLIGIDTPESKANNKAYKDAYKSKRDIDTITALGKRSTGFIKGLVKKGDIINIEYDVEKRDRYKRLLGYVYVSSGKMINEVIILSGYANIMTIPPNVKYAERFQKAYKEARENMRGLWQKNEKNYELFK